MPISPEAHAPQQRRRREVLRPTIRNQPLKVDPTSTKEMKSRSAEWREPQIAVRLEQMRSHRACPQIHRRPLETHIAISSHVIAQWQDHVRRDASRALTDRRVTGLEPDADLPLFTSLRWRWRCLIRYEISPILRTFLRQSAHRQKNQYPYRRDESLFQNMLLLFVVGSILSKTLSFLA
jgi:hypothetical protein